MQDTIEVDVIKKMMERNGDFTCRIGTDAMEPLVAVGDLVRMSLIHGAGQLARFDLVVYRQGENLICKYVWQVNLGGESVQLRSLRGAELDSEVIELSKLIGRINSHKFPWSLRTRMRTREFLSGDA